MPFKNPHPLYSVWQGMRRRCLTPSFKQWRDYGGRGISICERWDSFAAFAADMGERPPGSSLDRIDNDGNYSPENCRWSTKADQQRNQRVTRHVIIEGVRYRAADLADLSGHKTDTILDRVARGMTYAEVVNSGSFVTAAHLATAGGGKASGAKKRARTHCKRGHAFSAANTYNTAGGHRACRACHNAKMKRRNLAAREARAEISARSTFP